MIHPCAAIENYIQKQVKDCFQVESHVIFPTPWKDSMITFRFKGELVTIQISGNCQNVSYSAPHQGYTYWQKNLCHDKGVLKTEE